MERLIKIQQGLRIPKNKEGDKGRFKFRSAEDIFEKVKPLLAETETAVVVSDELCEVSGRCAIKATATLIGKDNKPIATANGWACMDSHIVIDKYSGQEKKSMSNEQCTGSASSYARKYALGGLFAIDNDELDPDQPEVGTKDPQPKQQPAPTQKTAPQPAVQLTPEQMENKNALLADIDATEDLNQLTACVVLATGQPYEQEIRAKANARAAAKGWHK